MSERVRTLAGASLALSLIFVSGCVRIPDSGAVRASYRGDAQDELALVEVRPPGPQPDDTPQQIAQGFLNAMQAYPPTSLVARQFLTPGAAARWQPETGTVIYSDQVTSQIEPGRVRLEGTKLASLSERGSWSSAAEGGGDYRHTFRLRRIDGQWRIANPPSGTLVPQAYFERYYRPYALYFLDPSRDILVPDLIYLPGGAQTPTLLVKGLLRGPTRWLEGSVETLVPVSTEVDLSVPVSSSGVADVALSAEVLNLAAPERQLLLAQLVWTLRQVPTITGVSVSVGGSILEIPGSEGIVPMDALPGFDPAGLLAARDLYGLRGDQLVTISGSDVRPVAGPFGTGRVPAAAPAVAVDGERAAVVSGRRRVVLVSGIQLGASTRPASAVRWYAGTRVLRTSWDASGRLWIVDERRSGAKVVVADGDGKPVELPIRGITGEEVRALRVARDGVRLAAVVETGDGAQILLGRIHRSAGGAVRGVTGVGPVANPLVRFSDVVDLAWTSPTTLAVLARSGKGPLQPYLVAIDGSYVLESTPLPDPGVTEIAAAPNPELPIVVGTASGRLWVRRADLRWTSVGDEGRVRSPVYPG